MTNDERIYRDELSPWLPSRIIDCHVHVSLPEHRGPVSPERLRQFWAMEVEGPQSWEKLAENHRALFAEQVVSALVFGDVYREHEIERNNEYVFAGRSERAEVLLVTRPEWEASRIEDELARGFLGIKPYPDLAPQKSLEVSIYDFVPPSHLALLDRLGGIVMLHLPRAGRLGDPENIRELLEISERYPGIKLIVAHIGRAYCLPTARAGLAHFADRAGVYFDTAANLNAEVFQFALETIGPDRILFGSDLPIMMMRGVREHVGDQYVNYTDGPYTWNTNRKAPEIEAEYTSYLYEELRALIRAVERSGMGKESFEKIMYSNSARLLGKPQHEGG